MSYREIKEELTRTFPTEWHTPKWNQPQMISGHPVGCGATAWAIVYAYWKAFKGKNNLFEGYDVYNKSSVNNSNDEQIKTVMGKIAYYTETDYGNLGGQYGFTQPMNMCNGIKYAQEIGGYKNSTCERIRGTEFNKFDQIKQYIGNDKPVILLIDKDGEGIPNHYVVIEAAVKIQKKPLWRWYDRDVKYLVNYGWGDTRKWIYVREVGDDTHEVYTAASAYLIDVK